MLFPTKKDNYKASRNRGLVILAKPAANVINLSEIDVLEGTNFHVDLRCFEINDHFILTGYKSPSTNPTTLFLCLQRLLEKVPPNKHMTIIGDLNLESGESKKFQNQIIKKLILPKHFSHNNFFNQLNLDDETTIRGTQVDVVFSTSDEGYAGVYPTYFSDHNVVFYRSFKPTEQIDNNPPKDPFSKDLMFQNSMEIIVNETRKTVKNMCCFNTLVHGFLEIYERNDQFRQLFERSSNELFNLIHKLRTSDDKEIQREMWLNYLYQYSPIKTMIDDGDMKFSGDEMIEVLLGQNYSSYLVQLKCWQCKSEKVVRKASFITMLRATSYDIRYLQKSLLKGNR